MTWNGCIHMARRNLKEIIEESEVMQVPKVVLSKAMQEFETKQKGLIGVLAKYRVMNGYVSWADAAPSFGMKPTTFYNRLKHPEKLTIGELRRIVRSLKIPLEEILPYVIWQGQM